MKKLFTLIAIVLTVQCFGQNSGTGVIFYSDKIVWDLDTTGGLPFYLEPDSVDYTPAETPITIEDIERWIEHCYNDSTLLKHQHFGVKGEMCLIDWECISESHYKDIWIHKNPNDIVGLLKWIKDN